jgi:hypothetical protein
MTNQTPPEDAGKAVKNSSNTAQRPISTRTLAGAVLVLLAALGIGMIIREFRFRLAVEKLPAQTPKTVQPPDILETNQAPKEPEIQNIQEQLPVEEVFVSPEPESVDQPPIPTVDIGGQSSTGARAETAEVPQYKDPRLNDPVFKEQLGRYVLSFVGYDPEAEEIWAALINDPSLSGQVRQDLIEDLNENGFSDGNGRIATVDDLPLILYRIQLVELFAPYAMDEVNSDAFDEVYKDLVNMSVRLTQQ